MEPLVTGWWVEVIGYVGMAFVIIAFFFKEAKTIRTVNLVGSALCCIYGILTFTIPTAALNGSLTLINSTFLIANFVKASKKAKEDKAKALAQEGASEEKTEE